MARAHFPDLARQTKPQKEQLFSTKLNCVYSTEKFFFYVGSTATAHKAVRACGDQQVE